MNHRSRQLLSRLALPLLLTLASACSRTPAPSAEFLSKLQTDSKSFDSGAASQIVTMAHSEHGKWVALGRESGAIDIWETGKTGAKRVIQAHRHRASQIQFTADGSAFFSNSYFEDMTKLWDANTGQLLHVIPDTRGPVGHTPDRNFYLVANNSHLHVFDLAKRQPLPKSYESGGVVESIALHAAAGRLAIGTASGTIETWSIAMNKGEPLLKLQQTIAPYPAGEWIIGVHFSSDGKSLHSVSRFGAIDEWDAASLQKKRALRSKLQHVHAARFHRAKPWLALAGAVGEGDRHPGLIEVIDLASGEAAQQPANSAAPAVEFLPAANILLAAQNRSLTLQTLKDR